MGLLLLTPLTQSINEENFSTLAPITIVSAMIIPMITGTIGYRISLSDKPKTQTAGIGLLHYNGDSLALGMPALAPQITTAGRLQGATLTLLGGRF